MTDSTYTHLAIVADRSGSMKSIAGDMNDGLREFLDAQGKLEGKLAVDVVTFDGIVETLIASGAVSDIPHPLIAPRGVTALNDAIGTTISDLGSRFEKMKEDERPGKVIVLIITDGMENSSREYSSEQVKKLVTQQQDEWGWDFVFLGANIDSFSVGGSLGVSRGGTLNYDATAQGVSSVLLTASEYVTRSRTSTVRPDLTQIAKEQEGQ